MSTTRLAPSRLAAACTTATLALLAAFTVTDSLVAQAQIQAYYPLLTDQLDITSTYGPVSLLGTPPPSPPNNGVCVNGIYINTAGGQDVRTPLMPTLTTTDFEIDVEFNIAAFPTSFPAPVLMGGTSWRWLGIYLMPNGTVGIKHNNNNLLWSTTTLATGVWYSAALKYETGTVALFIDGALVLQASIGPLSDGNNKNITTNDLSNGRNFNGCIRTLVVINDTTLLATATPYAAGCAGSAGVPALTPGSLPRLGTTFTLNATNLVPSAVFAFISIGFSNTTSLLGPLPVSLTPFGLGAGCNLLVSADATNLIGAAGGTGTMNVPVPSNATLIALALFFQCASIDAGAAGGIAVSNGVAASIGL